MLYAEEEEEEEEEVEEDVEAEEYPLLLDELAKSVALVNQASLMVRIPNDSEWWFYFAVVINDFESVVVCTNRTPCCRGEISSTLLPLTTILHRAVKRTNWPPPLTPSQLNEYDWNVGGLESIGAVISRCCELLFVLQTALERDGFLHGNSENSNSNSRVVYGQGTCEAALQQYDFVAETFAIAVKKRFVKAFANTQHSRAPELMLNCCAKQIEFLP